jgi:uncharacterized protein YcgI (DUF1989 family)
MIEIPPQSGTGLILRKGQTIKIIDPEGLQVADFFCFSADDPHESLSSSRSIDYNDTVRLTKGHALYSNRSSIMAVILEDTCGRHDFLMPPCSLRMFQLVAGNEAYHPSCHENLAMAFAPFRLDPDRITTTFNLFMNVSAAPDGGLSILPPRSKPGDFVVLEARMDLIVALTACSHEESNAGAFKPIRYEVRSGASAKQEQDRENGDRHADQPQCAPAPRSAPRMNNRL